MRGVRVLVCCRLLTRTHSFAIAVLLPPLMGMQKVNARVEGDALVLEVRVSLNTNSPTLEQSLEKMKNSYLQLLHNMHGTLRVGGGADDDDDEEEGGGSGSSSSPGSALSKKGSRAWSRVRERVSDDARAKRQAATVVWELLLQGKQADAESFNDPLMYQERVSEAFGARDRTMAQEILHGMETAGDISGDNPRGYFPLAIGSLGYRSGLAGLVGAPDADVYEAMTRECVDPSVNPSATEWYTTRNYGITTQVALEYYFTADPATCARLCAEAGLPGEWPVESVQMELPAKPRRPPFAGELAEACQKLNARLHTMGEAQQLRLEDVRSMHMYTGAMFVPLNAELRALSRFLSEDGSRVATPIVPGQVKLRNTLHVVSSALRKVSHLTKVETVYRSMPNGRFPSFFWDLDEHGVRGGVELAFMSTTRERAVAMSYASGGNAGVAYSATGARRSVEKPQLFLEISQGYNNRAADISCISQYGHENELTFPPCTALQISSINVKDSCLLVKANASVGYHW